MHTYNQQSHVVVEVLRIVSLVDDNSADVDDFGVRRSYSPIQASSDHPKVAGCPLSIVVVYQTVRGRQDGPIVDETSATKVATTERGLIVGFSSDWDLENGSKLV